MRPCRRCRFICFTTCWTVWLLSFVVSWRGRRSGEWWLRVLTFTNTTGRRGLRLISGRLLTVLYLRWMWLNYDVLFHSLLQSGWITSLIIIKMDRDTICSCKSLNWLFIGQHETGQSSEEADCFSNHPYFLGINAFKQFDSSSDGEKEIYGVEREG